MKKFFTLLFFAILVWNGAFAQGSIQLNYPNGGETFTQGSFVWVTWQGVFSDPVDLYFSDDNGNNWNGIENNISGNGYYWEVPVILSSQCLLKVESGNLEDESNASFSIIEPLINTNQLVIDSIVPPIICQQDSFQVYFSANGTFNPGNSFVLQLSDINGDFTNANFLGISFGQASGAITGIIPGFVLSGNGYRVRVIASDLYTEGADNGSDLTLNGPSVDFEADSTFLLLPNAGVNFSFIGNTTGIVNYVWDFGDGPAGINSSTAFHNFTEEEYHDITLTVEASNGCATSLTKHHYIRVEEMLPCIPLLTQTTENLVAVGFTNNTNGCFATETGNCLITTDGGQNFSMEPTGMFQIKSVSLIPGSWFLAGTNGLIKYSSDMGQNWSSQTINPATTASFNSICVSSSTSGYAAGDGGMIYKFDGNSWNSDVSGVLEDINSVYTITNQTYAVGNLGTILKNGGAMWVAQNSPVSTKLTGVWFVSPDSGMICSTEGLVLATIDGGLNWNIVLDGVEQDFNAISATSDTFYVAGNSGVIYRTYDFGATWNRFSTGNTNAANSVYLKARRGWVAGSAGNGLNFGLAGFDPSGKGEIFKASHLIASPNPFAETLSLYTPQQESGWASIEIYDIAGRSVFYNPQQAINNGKLNIDLHGLNAGSYLLKFQTQEIIRSLQVVKH
jgi:photosystem II stability/assembly factor-like uncharacterized protein